MSEFFREYLIVFFFILLAVAAVGGLITIASVLRPNRPSKGKIQNYESGVDPTEGGWSQSQIRYYIFALLFVMFEVEAVFVLPWATVLEELGWFGLIEMVIFIFILALGLGYAWRKGVLKWA